MDDARNLRREMLELGGGPVIFGVDVGFPVVAEPPLLAPGPVA